MRITTKRQNCTSRGAGVVAYLRSVAPSNELTTDEIMALMRSP